MAKTINDKLPEEMLIEVFEYLDGKSVKEAALVCKEWNRVISTSLKIMKKFILKIDCSSTAEGDQKFEQLLTLERHFTSADIFWEKRDGSQLMQLIERFGRKLTSLKLKYMDWDTVKILEKTPELEKLEIYLAERKKATSLRPVSMKNLKKLKVGSGENVFSLIKAPMLTHLDATGIDYRLKPRMRKIITNFLQASPKLESLKMDEWLLDQVGPSFPFQLKEFECSWYFYLSDNIKQFLLSQAATVEKLQIISKDSETIEFILMKFKGLKSLSASMSVASDEFFENLEPKPLVKELRLHSAFTSLDSLRVVLRKFPEIEKLETSDGLTDEQLEVVAETNKKLKILSMRSVDNYGKPLSVKFPSLRSLEVMFFFNLSRESLVFLKANPNIESLFIKHHGRGPNADNIIDLLNETSLKLIIIKDEPGYELKNLYIEMESRFATWETIELELSSKSIRIHLLRETQHKTLPLLNSNEKIMET